MPQPFAASQRTFAAGEVSPQLARRSDLAKVQTALAACENFVVLIEGGVTRSPGSIFVMELPAPAEAGLLIPFQAQRDDAYVVVLNGGQGRVIRNGGVVLFGGAPYAFPVPWAAADLAALRWTQSADTLFVGCKGTVPRELVRFDHDDWRLSTHQPTDGPTDLQNTDQVRTIQASGVTGSVTLTANTATFDAGDVGGIYRLDEPNLATTPLWRSGETGIGAGARRRWNGNTYAAASGGDAGATAPTHEEGTVSAGAGLVAWQFVHDSYGTVLVTTVLSATSAIGTVQRRIPDTCVSAPTYRWFPPAWSSKAGWPEIPRLYQQRLFWFRGDKFWASKSNEYRSHDAGPTGATVADDDAFWARIVSPDGQLVSVEWAMSSKVLALGCSSGEWLIRPSDAAAVLTPTNVSAVDDSSEGSASQVPARVDGGAVFIGRSGARAHFVRLDVIAERLETQELTVTARHILKDARAVVWQRDPHRICWIATAAGALVGLTFMSEQQVIGWHRHPRSGFVEDLAAVRSADGLSDEVYMIVRRTIGGMTRRFVERLAPFPQDGAPTATGMVYLEAALTYEGPAVTTLSGLGHLEGETVSILADGKLHPQRQVDGGAVTLDFPAAVVAVGLPLTARLRTLPVEAQTQAGETRGKPKRIRAVILDRVASRGGRLATVHPAGEDPESLSEAFDIDDTGDAVMGAPPPLFTGETRVVLEAPHDDAVSVEITCAEPLPFMLTGIVADATVDG